MIQKSLFDTPETIREQVKELHRQEIKIALELEQLQQICKHENAKKEHGGNTGNYDPTADVYWVTTKCDICGARWQHMSYEECPECGKWHTDVVKGCDMVYGRRGWRQLGVYDG